MAGTPLAWPALQSGLAFSAGLAVVALLGGAVRVLPWLIEPSVPFRVALPFARSVGELAVEAALLVGFPIGFSLAAHRFAARGDARVHELLGEAPGRTVARLLAPAAPFLAALALVSVLGGRDAEAPGRVAQDLVDQGRVACAASEKEMTRTVPFVGATWLCAPSVEPRLYGRAPLGGSVYTASNLRVAGDMRRVDLDDARVLVGETKLTAGTLTLKGLSPFAQSSALPPFLRAVLVVLSALGAAFVATRASLRRRLGTALESVALGAVGPLAALGVLRLLDRADAPVSRYALVPLAATLAAAGVAWLFGWRSRRT